MISVLPAVRQSLEQLVDLFLKIPYLHRREHSLHCTLYELLINQGELGGLWPIGKTARHTRLVHKEWPWPDRIGGTRRGNHDLAILSPSSLSAVDDIESFIAGYVQPECAIEIGLNYDLKHLTKDRDTLQKLGYLNNGFLVHLEQPHIKHDPLTYEKLLKFFSECELPSVAVIYRGENTPLVKHLPDREPHGITS